MAAETARTRRLRTDHAKILALLERAGDQLAIESATGDPPTRYVLRYRCKSLEGVEASGEVWRTEHRVEIKIPSGYPLEPPAVRMLTPIFHPHVFISGNVCLGSRWQVGEGLDNLVLRIGAILRFEPAYLDFKSPANLDAAHWASAHLGDLPLEPNAIGPADARPTERAITWTDAG